MTIYDPGNAEHAITIGSTHSTDPLRYGVSYFSAKGPTADGRLKPDLVAPGERVLSCAPPSRSGDEAQVIRGARYVEDTGTGQAAAAVSGAIAALLSVRHHLIGKPHLVKQLLTSTAEDLNRDRYIQGYGLVNLMRALVESTAIERSSKSVEHPRLRHLLLLF
jgi:serine protease AprX